MTWPLEHDLSERSEKLVLPAHPTTDDDGARVEGHDEIRHTGGAGRDGLLPDGDRPRVTRRRRGLDLPGSEGPEPRVAGEPGDATPRSQLLER